MKSHAADVHLSCTKVDFSGLQHDHQGTLHMSWHSHVLNRSNEGIQLKRKQAAKVYFVLANRTLQFGVASHHYNIDVTMVTFGSVQQQESVFVGAVVQVQLQAAMHDALLHTLTTGHGNHTTLPSGHHI